MNGKMIRTVLKEYGAEWVVNRSLYSAKLKLMSTVSRTEKLFEKKVYYPSRLDIFSFDVEKVKSFLRKLPEKKKKELKQKADDACDGKITGFSSIELNYGYKLNWQLNPLTGEKCSIKDKWYRIPDFDPERGDIKVIWEASRFSHFVTLARAYLLTEDEKYYRTFSVQLDDWIKDNPYSFGANFKCGQECSLRLVNGLLAYTVFNESGISTKADKKNIETLILRCYRKVLSNFFYAYKCIKNNHTISELLGMIIGAWCCRDEERLSNAFKKLNEVIDEQFTGDGGYIQYSFNYERLALQDIEVVLSIEKKAGYKLDKNSRKKILAAANLMYQCQDDSGDMPNYGSNDGALVFPVTSCGYRDFRPVINTIYAILTGKKLYGQGLYDEELLWFGNDSYCDREKKNRISTAFNEAGLYTLRRADSWAMIVLNNYKSRPAHMDQLHFDLWICGVNVLCDSGTYSYASKKGKELIRNISHNTVVYDEQSQMNIQGTFMIYDWTNRGRVKHTGSLFEGEMKSLNGYSHHRSIKVTDEGYSVADRVEGDKTFKVLFHTPCEVLENNGELELWVGGRGLCRIRSSGRSTISRTYRSLYYLKKEEITCIEFSANAKNRMITNIEIIQQEER